MRTPRHGTDGEYNNHKCRCDECKAAHAKACREARLKNPETQRRHRARSKFQYAVLCGDIVPQVCEICNFDEVQGHHEDYSKPLEVRWLCIVHHAQEAKKMGEKHGSSPHVYKVGSVRIKPRKKRGPTTLTVIDNYGNPIRLARTIYDKLPETLKPELV